MTTISEDRVERAATALLSRRSGAWDDRDLARAALVADAPAILAAKIEELKRWEKIAMHAIQKSPAAEHWFNAFTARIASLEAKMKEGGK